MHQVVKLHNDTIVNVSQLLKAPVGDARTVDIQVDELFLDDDLRALELNADVRLTRVVAGVLAHGEVRGVAELECVRCLTTFAAPFSGQFDAEFYPTIDVRTGESLPVPEDEETFTIDNNHQLDVREVLRQESLLALPFRPVCGDACPGFQPEFPESLEGSVDERLAALGALLDEQGET